MDIQYVTDAYVCVMYMASYILKEEKGMVKLLKQAAKELEQGNIRQQLNKIGSLFLTNQELSAQEAVYRVLSMALRRCSRSFVFLNTDSKESSNSLLLPFAWLQKLDDSDTDIYCKNIIERYAARPQILENMSLAEFVANCTYKQETHNNMVEDKDELSGESEREFGDDYDDDNDNSIVQASMITLQNCLGSMKKRKRKAILRWLNFNIKKEPEKHFRSRIMLFLPWRTESELLQNHTSYIDRYHSEIDRIKVIENMFIHQEEDINSAFEHLQDAGPPPKPPGIA